MRPVVKRLRKESAYVLIRFAVWFFRHLPRNAALAIASAFGQVMPFLTRRDYRRAREQLALAFGEEKSEQEIRRIAREVFRILALNFIDTIRLKVMTTEEVNGVCIPHDMDRCFREYDRGRGIIALSGHVGCWEVMGTYLAGAGMKVDAIARKLYDTRLEELLLDTRESGGMNVISRGENTRQILRAFRDGHLVGMLVDQDIPNVKGEFADFFGRPAYTPVAPAFLSLRYGVPIVPLFTCRDAVHNHHIFAGEPVTIEPTGDLERDVRLLTAASAKVTEDFIRKHPEQWVWFHQRWKTTQDMTDTAARSGEEDNDAPADS